MRASGWRRIAVVVVVVVVVLLLAGYVSTSEAVSFTLSDAGIMALDVDLWAQGAADEARVLSRVDVPGNGVRLEIYFPASTAADEAVEWVSCTRKGAGWLVGRDTSAYDSFALQFTLLGVQDNYAMPNGRRMVVGAMIDMALYGAWGYQPRWVGSGPYAQTNVSTTPTYGTETIATVGFTAYIPYHEYSSLAQIPWSPGPSTVSLLVAPAPGAVQIPEPGTLGLLALGGAAVWKRRRARRI